MMASMAAFTFNDLCIKAIGTAVPLSQVLFLRGILASVLIYLLARYMGALVWPDKSADRWLIVIRSAAEVAAAYFFLTALLNMPFANVTAILQTLPLTVTLAAALVFREPVGWRRLLAIVIGFSGMMLIVRPGSDGFTIHSVYVLVAVACVTVRDLAARRLSSDIPSTRVALSAATGVTAMAGLAAIAMGEVWVMPTTVEMALLAGAALCLMAGYTAAVAGMRGGDLGFVAPFRYTSLLVALILGFVLFDEWPDALTMIGAGIVVATGLFTIYRERSSRHSSGLSTRGLRPR